MPSASPARSARSARLAALLVALCAAVAYAGTLGHEFVFDDTPEVVHNEAIRSLGQVPWIFAHAAWAGSGEDNPIYRPLTTATYALNHALGGLAPLGFHLGNVLLHALASALVLALALALGMPLAGALGAGLLFALLPVHVEAVANVAGRKDLLATVLVLAALLAHRRALGGGRAALALAPLALLGAMFSKETGVAGLGILAAHDLLFARPAWRARRGRALALYGVYGLELVGYFAARRAAVGSLGVPLAFVPYTENPLAHVAFGPRLLTALATVGRGVALLVAPVRLSPDYSYAAIPPVTSPADPLLFLGVAALAGAGLAAWRWRTSRPWVTLAVLWYLLALFPGSNLLVAVGTVFGERLLYLPSVGFCLAAGGLLAWGLATRAGPALRWAAAAVLVLCAVRSVAYARVWSDELTLFTYGARVQPASSKMLQCLAGALMERGEPERAVVPLQEALRVLAGSPASVSRPRLELGVAYEALGRSEEAAALYEQVLRDDPAYADASWRLGVVRWAQGRRPEAIGWWQRTIARHPDHAPALSDLGLAYAAGGDEDAARALWERAVAADRRVASAWYRLGNVYARQGDLGRARQAWRTFLDNAHGRFPREQADAEAKLGLAR